MCAIEVLYNVPKIWTIIAVYLYNLTGSIILLTIWFFTIILYFYVNLMDVILLLVLFMHI